MNVLIVAVWLNIIIVNAKYAVIDIDKILNIIQRRTENSGSRETNEPVETLPIMPGFYMVKPEGMSFSKFKYPQGKAVTPLSVEKMDEFVSKLEPKAASRDSTSKDLILKIFKDVFNGDPNSRDRYFETRDAENDTEQNIPTTTLQNKELLAKLINNVKNTRDSEDYKYGTISNQEDIPKDYKLNTEINQKEVLSKIIMDAVNNVHKSRGSKKYASAIPSDDKKQSVKIKTKNKNVLARLITELQNVQENRASDERRPMIMVKAKPSYIKKSPTTLKIEELLNKMDLEEFDNDGGEILDEDEEDEDDDSNGFRRAKKHKSKNRSAMYTSEKESDASSSVSAVEKNPGNPFTIHKNKYRQNWLWNHYMDGDHMNINPFGPQFQSLGPTGPELFFGRKWWYYNQDDFKPMG